MSDTERLRDMINLEVFLFQGVPERPNPVYGRDANCNVNIRRTRSQVQPDATGNAIPDDSENQPPLERITVDFEADVISFDEFLQH